MIGMGARKQLLKLAKTVDGRVVVSFCGDVDSWRLKLLKYVRRGDCWYREYSDPMFLLCDLINIIFTALADGVETYFRNVKISRIGQVWKIVDSIFS